MIYICNLLRFGAILLHSFTSLQPSFLPSVLPSLSPSLPSLLPSVFPSFLDPYMSFDPFIFVWIPTVFCDATAKNAGFTRTPLKVSINTQQV